jgi:hypothetical protein
MDQHGFGEMRPTTDSAGNTLGWRAWCDCGWTYEANALTTKRATSRTWKLEALGVLCAHLDYVRHRRLPEDPHIRKLLVRRPTAEQLRMF